LTKPVDKPLYVLLVDSDRTMRSSADDPVKWIDDERVAKAWLHEADTPYSRAVLILHPDGSCSFMPRPPGLAWTY
jgi:hypothetical protein